MVVGRDGVQHGRLLVAERSYLDAESRGRLVDRGGDDVGRPADPGLPVEVPHQGPSVRAFLQAHVGESFALLGDVQVDGAVPAKGFVDTYVPSGILS